MTISAATLEKLVAAGLEGEALIDVVRSIEADHEKPRSSGAIRQANYRARKRASHGDVTRDVTEDDEEGFPHTPSQEIPPLKEKPPKGVKKKNGSRIPEDFQPDIGWAVSQALPRRDAEVQAAKFVDYWRGKSGAAAVKLDWPATWRNWVRSHAERAGITLAATAPIEIDDARWQARLRLARDRKVWSTAEWGPRPREPGCLVPQSLLSEGDGIGWSEHKQVA